MMPGRTPREGATQGAAPVGFSPNERINLFRPAARRASFLSNGYCRTTSASVQELRDRDDHRRLTGGVRVSSVAAATVRRMRRAVLPLKVETYPAEIARTSFESCSAGMRTNGSFPSRYVAGERQETSSAGARFRCCRRGRVPRRFSGWGQSLGDEPADSEPRGARLSEPVPARARSHCVA